MFTRRYYVRRTIELLQNPHCRESRQLAETLELSKATMNKLLSELLLLGDIHVWRWKLLSTKSMVREFAPGRGVDAQKPASNAELVARLEAGDTTVYADKAAVAAVHKAAALNIARRERYNYQQRLKTAAKAAAFTYHCEWTGPILTRFVDGKNPWLKATT